MCHSRSCGFLDFWPTIGILHDGVAEVVHHRRDGEDAAQPFVQLFSAAGGLLAAHVAALLLGYGPARMEVGADLVMLWVPRAAAVWLAALVVWLTARAYTGHATPTLFWLAGLAAALVGAVVAAVVIPTRDLRAER